MNSRPDDSPNSDSIPSLSTHTAGAIGSDAKSSQVGIFAPDPSIFSTASSPVYSMPVAPTTSPSPSSAIPEQLVISRRIDSRNR